MDDSSAMSAIQTAEPASAPTPLPAGAQVRRGQRDPLWVRCLLIGTAIGVITCLILVPIAHVFIQALGGPKAFVSIEALGKGLQVYWTSLTDPNTRHAMALTMVVAPLAVLANLVFGLAA